jgi:hypothetical protein
MLVLLGLDQHVEDFTLLIDSAPQIEPRGQRFSDNPHQDAGCCMASGGVCASRLRLWPEMIYPALNRLVRDQDPTLSQLLFHIAKAERESKIQPDLLLDDLWRER